MDGIAAVGQHMSARVCDSDSDSVSVLLINSDDCRSSTNLL
jgi:hypothetical protein